MLTAPGRLAGLLLLLLVTWGMYTPLLTPGATTFVYEDALTLQANPMVRGLQPISLSTPRWLTWTTYRIDAWRGGQTWQFHATSGALHLIVGMLVFALLWRWGASPWATFFATGLVLLHPITVESVGYLTARSELIFAIGVLLALHCTPRRGDWTVWRLLGVFVSTYLAIGGKELGIVTPALVWMVKPLPRSTWMPLTMLAVIAVYRLLDHHTAVGASPYPPLHAFVLQCVAVARGVRLLIWPTGLTVDADIAAAGLAARAGAMALLAALGLVAWRWRQVPAVAWIAGWLAITIGPRLVADSWEFVNEHQWYVPLIGIALAVGLARRTPPALIFSLGPGESLY